MLLIMRFTVTLLGNKTFDYHWPSGHRALHQINITDHFPAVNTEDNEAFLFNLIIPPQSKTSRVKSGMWIAL